MEDVKGLENEPEEEKEPQEEAIYLGSDNEAQSDAFESHFASPSPSRSVFRTVRGPHRDGGDNAKKTGRDGTGSRSPG